MTDPNAANGQGDPLSSATASFARRIQYARVAKEIPLMLSVGSAIDAVAVIATGRPARRRMARIVYNIVTQYEYHFEITNA
jgi:hypothetical protein